MLSKKERVILLCGAGASAFLGLPTLDDLLKRAVLGNDEVATRIRSTRDAIEYAPNRFGKAVFEELIVKLREYLHLSQTLRIDATFKKEFGAIPTGVDNGEIERKWKQALTKCYRVLLEEYGPERIDTRCKEFQTTLQFFKELCKLNGGTLHIYTTNYDCSYQVLASKSPELGFLSHISNKDGVFSENWYYSNPIHTNKALPSVFIHRLHGCIGWFNTSSNQSWETSNVVREVFGTGGGLEINDDDYLPRMSIKLIASQLVGTNPVFSIAFEEFVNHLKEIDTLLIWGYSFRDLEVLRLINHAFSERAKPMNVFYIDPYMGESRAKDNIQATLLNAPIHKVSDGFSPKQVDWKPSDGHKSLITSTLRTFKNS